MKKKNLMFVCACLLMSHAVSAQSKGEEIQFHRHGSLQLQGGAAYTLGEAGFGDLVSPAVGVHGSYYFTPVWGLRAGVSGYESKGAWVNPLQVYKYNYLQGDIDVVVDLANCFKYNYKRVVNPFLFLGIGLNGAFGNDEAVAVNDGGHTLEYLWRDRQFNPVGRGGIGANVRLGGRVYFNLEVNANVLGDKYNSKKAGNPDWVFNALGGLVIKLGKTHKKVVEEAPEPVAPPVIPEKREPVTPKKAEPVVEKAKVEKLQENVFFKLNSAVIRASEEAKIERLAAYLTANPQAKVVICGYADKATGTPKINDALSLKRAQAVSKALQVKKIDAGRIRVEHKGDSVQPFTEVEKNRVSICIAE